MTSHQTAEAHRILVEIYESAPTDKSYREWCWRFKSGDIRPPKKFEDEKLKALLATRNMKMFGPTWLSLSKTSWKRRNRSAYLTRSISQTVLLPTTDFSDGCQTILGSRRFGAFEEIKE